eukprot:jgi/Picre1/30482/NNA_005846.t1
MPVVASRTGGSGRHDRKMPIDKSTKEYLRQKTACSALSVPRTQHPSLSEEEGGIRRQKNPGKRRDLSETVFENATIFSMKTEEGVRLTMTQQGQLTLWDEDLSHSSRGVARLVSEASLVLPDVCAGVLPSIITKKDCGSNTISAKGKDVEEVLVRWGPKESPYALLHVIAHHRHEEEWTGGMKKGFVLEFKVQADAAPSSGAEISVKLEPSGHWFGGGHFIRQIWPLNDASLEVGPWYAFDNGPNGVNNLVGAHWITSCGLLVSVDPSTQYLHIGMNAPNKSRKWQSISRKWGVGIQNATRELLPLTKGHGKVARAGQDGLLRIQVRSNYVDAQMEHPLRHWQHDMTSSDVFGGSLCNDMDMLTVRVSMGVAENAAEACKMALGGMVPPKETPDLALFKRPIWTTWARYKTRVCQDKVLKYAQEIVDRGLPRSVMEIDDRWQVAYGDLAFDEKKFPDPVGMVNTLHEMGFKVTTWVHPFVERQSEAYLEGARKGYFVGCDMADHPIERGSKVGFFKWWNTQPVAALDVTNPDAVDWFVNRLKELQEKTGVDGFKFDAGEPCFLPRMPRTYQPLSTPAEYTQLYVQRVAGQFAGGVSEFSLAPWDLGRDTEMLVAKALKTRSKFEDHLAALAQEAADTLTPICRPMWMIAPEEEETYEIEDQFALGNDVIVAPVVRRGARQRDVYLTSGMWRDFVDGSLIEGGQWLKNVAAPLDHLPIYVRDGIFQ